MGNSNSYLVGFQVTVCSNVRKLLESPSFRELGDLTKRGYFPINIRLKILILGANLLNMKKSILILTLGLLSSCGYYRMGDLTMASNRNVDSGKEYVLLAKNVEATVKTKKGDAIERAIDGCTDAKNGDYLMNVKIYFKKNGRKVRVIGDVYGIPTTDVKVNSKVEEEIVFKVGDKVAFSKGKKVINGVIIGVNANGAIVEYMTMLGIKKNQLEVPFYELTKLS